jgi:hypothetical protein
VQRKIDIVGFALVVALVVIAAGAAYAALEYRWFNSGWELAAWIVVGVAFVAVALGLRHHHAPPQNAGVYGTAQPASESEAQAAARGSMKTPSLHDRTFPD